MTACPDPLGGLVARAREGDDAAFAALVTRTHAETWTLAVRLIGDADDAADVVQEAYIRAHRGLSGFREDARFTTWLHRITVNCASTHLGRRRRHRHESLETDLPLADDRRDADPQARLDDDVLRGELAAVIATIPPRLRAVLVLRDVYDLSHGVIAAELGISVTASKVRLHRARSRLREALTAHGAAPAGGRDAGSEVA